MGYYTLALDKNPDSMGFSCADDYKVIDIVDQDSCLKFAHEKCIDGVISPATEYGVLSAAYIAKQLNLPGLHYSVAKTVKNKYLVRRAFWENKIDGVSQFYEIDTINKLGEIRSSLQFPLIVKPCDGSGSKAVKRVDNFEQLQVVCNEAMQASLIGKALIEDFITGTEYGVESFVYRDQIYILGIMGKIMACPPDYAELGHYMPSNLQIEEKVKAVVKAAIQALEINFGSVNMDLLITEDNRVCIVDVGARMGGNLIGSHVIPLGSGIDYLGNIIRAAVGDPVDFTKRYSGLSVATRLLALSPGRIAELPNFDEIEQQYCVKVYHNLNIGDIIKQYHNNLDGCGYVVATAKTVEEAQQRAEKVKELINRSIIRDLSSR